jgi:hypothetical protein
MSISAFIPYHYSCVVPSLHCGLSVVHTRCVVLLTCPAALLLLLLLPCACCRLVTPSMLVQSRMQHPACCQTCPTEQSCQVRPTYRRSSSSSVHSTNCDKGKVKQLIMGILIVPGAGSIPAAAMATAVMNKLSWVFSVWRPYHSTHQLRHSSCLHGGSMQQDLQNRSAAAAGFSQLMICIRTAARHAQ